VKNSQKAKVLIGNGEAQEAKRGSVVTEQLASVILQENRTGLNPNRSIKVYLPPSYVNSGKSYPVVIIVTATHRVRISCSQRISW
jgi:hypothetical protein